MTGHFEKFSIKRTDSGYDIEFINKDTGVDINMNIPEQGIFESDPKRHITQEEVRDLARQITDVLDSFLA